ncbi:hypothetical protein C0991_008554 [Blastosporella zonata]|nr:hypothetical protein C0991_008554 [Blastosporella zonata]
MPQFMVDEGWEGTIGVCLNWTTQAVVKLAPYAERLAYQAAQGPVGFRFLSNISTFVLTRFIQQCQACEKMGVGPTCWYLTARHLCCRCTNWCAVCKDQNGGSAQKPAPLKGRFCPHVPPMLALTDGGGSSSGLAEKLMRAWSEVDRMECLSRLARLELADLEAVLDAGGADAEGDEEEEEEDGEAEMAGRAEGDEEEREEDGEAKMARRAEGDKEEREAKRAKSEEEEAEIEVEREGREEAAERAESEGREEAPGGFRVLPRRVGSGLGRIAQRKREKMAAKRVAKGKMRRG